MSDTPRASVDPVKWREVYNSREPGDYYGDTIEVGDNGAIRLNAGGKVVGRLSVRDVVNAMWPDDLEPAAPAVRDRGTPPPTAKEQHLMDVYDSLGVKWGDDPFSAIAKLKRDREILRRCNIIEIAVANDTGSVSEYMNHWEGRALKAEAVLAALPVDLLLTVIDFVNGLLAHVEPGSVFSYNGGRTWSRVDLEAARTHIQGLTC